MEGTRALIELLRDWDLQLLEISHHAGVLDISVKELRQKILYALADIGVLVKTSNLEGGELNIDAKKIENTVRKFSVWEKGVYEALQEVETAWPFISANIQLLKEFTEAARSETVRADKLAQPLIPAVDNIELTDSDFLDKTVLSSFNKQMAVVYSRVGVLGEVTKDIIGDMTNAITLFENVRKLNTDKKIRSNIKERVSKNIDDFLKASVNFTQIFLDILAVVKEMKRPTLIPEDALRNRLD